MNPPSCFGCSKKKGSNVKYGPIYTHLGGASTFEKLRTIMETRTQVSGSKIRFAKIIYTQKEGKTTNGCPVAKWVFRRSTSNEKYLILVRNRVEHSCDATWTVVAIVAYAGLTLTQSDQLYTELCNSLGSKEGTERRCSINKGRICTCQGTKKDKCGESFSFGCSFNAFNKGCKFASCSTPPNKFRLGRRATVDDLATPLNNLADFISKMNAQLVPDCHSNQTKYAEKGNKCRLGSGPITNRPWSGVTICMDFCAHAHRDINNMDNGTTAVVTLTKHQPTEEQFHVLPKYRYIKPADPKMGMVCNVEIMQPTTKKMQVWATPLPRKAKSLKSKNSVSDIDKSGPQLKEENADYGYCFKDDEVGGVALALPHGSVLFEYAKAELHATTSLGQLANRNSPTRIGVILYQHQKLNLANHSHSEFIKCKNKRELLKNKVQRS